MCNANINESSAELLHVSITQVVIEMATWAKILNYTQTFQKTTTNNYDGYEMLYNYDEKQKWRAVSIHGITRITSSVVILISIGESFAPKATMQ